LFKDGDDRVGVEVAEIVACWFMGQHSSGVRTLYRVLQPRHYARLMADASVRIRPTLGLSAFCVWRNPPLKQDEDRHAKKRRHLVESPELETLSIIIEEFIERGSMLKAERGCQQGLRLAPAT
jgi:hypothetical protein